MNEAMTEPAYNYDEQSDTLYISFALGEHATGIELTDHILLRINKRDRRVVGITLLDYSVLAQQTDLGLRQFPLTGLAELSADLREMVLEMLVQPPVRDVLTLSAYTPTLSETTPVVAVQPLAIGAGSR